MAAVTPVASASKTQSTVIEDTGRLLSDNPDIRTAALDEVQALGVDVVKIPVTWRSYAPNGTSTTKPSIDLTDSYSYEPGIFAGLDGVITGAQARGLKVWLMVTAPAPRWAVSKETSPGEGAYLPDPVEYANFVKAVGKRYSSVRIWSFWNEANFKRFLQPQVKSGVIQSAVHYRDMYRAAYKSLGSSGHASDTILFGELLGRYQVDLPATATRPLAWLREFFCIDAKGKALAGSIAKRHKCTGYKPIKASGIAYHPYNVSFQPLAIEKASPDNAPIGYLPRVTKLLDQARKSKHLGSSKLKIYNSEYGIQSNPPDDAVGFPLSKIPFYLNVSEYLNFIDTRVATYSQYLIADDPDLGGFQTGLRFIDGTKKEGVYAAFQTPFMVFTTKNPKKITVWGALRAKPAGTVQAELQTGSGDNWTTLAKISVGASNGYFLKNVNVANAASKTFRISWSGGISRSSKPIAPVAERL
jgi:hypothetical protein